MKSVRSSSNSHVWWAGISMEVGAGGEKEEGGTVVTTFKGNSGVVVVFYKNERNGWIQ